MAKIHKLSNGLSVILEQIEHLESVAYELIIPGGTAYDKEQEVGASLILPDLTARGAGGLSSRQLNEAFDNSGIRHGEGAGQEHYSYRGSCLSEKLIEALRLVSLMITKPQLPENEIDSIRSLLIQDIKSLPDQPSRRVAVELSKSYFPHPFNRSSMGTEEGLQKADLALLTKLWTEFYKPDGSLLSIAGKFDEKNILNDLEKLFSNWQGKANGRIKFGTMPKMQKQHIPFDGAQLQIAMAFPSAPFGDKDYYSAKLACGILSGGMFGRLFIDVREKRGLCYSVYARHSATKDYGQVYAYAGTTPERAHETLDVMLMVFNQLKGSITQEELDRARANVLTAIIMSEESPGSRASSNSTDWWVAGELRTLDQIKNGLKAVTIQDINNYLERFPIKEYALTTLGAKDITKEH